MRTGSGLVSIVPVSDERDRAALLGGAYAAFSLL